MGTVAERRARAAARSSLGGQKGGLELERILSEPVGTPSERVAQVMQVTLLAWEISGQVMPKCPRQSLPGRLFHR
jgi:hypothetical protein